MAKNPPIRSALADRVRSIQSEPKQHAYLEVSDRKLRLPRQIVYRPARLVLERGEKLAVVIRDLSTGGMRVEFFRRTPLSDVVVVDEASLPIRRSARVIWQSDGRAGLVFVSR